MPRAEIPEPLDRYGKPTHTVHTINLANSLRMVGHRVNLMKEALEIVLKDVPKEGATREIIEACTTRLDYVADALTTEADMLDKWGES